MDHVLAVRIGDGGLKVDCPRKFAADISARLADGERILHSSAKLCRIHIPLTLPLRGGQRLILAGSKPEANPDKTLIAALRRAHAMQERDRKGMPVIAAAPKSPYLRGVLKLAFLAPDIQRRIMDGHQPPHFNLQTLLHMPLPLSWKKQREALDLPYRA